jgi:internalin A
MDGLSIVRECLPDARIWTPLDRARCAAHWKKESRELELIVKDEGPDVLGNKDFEHYRLLKKFAHQVGDILATIADIVQPRSFEEFEKYGLDPPDGPEDAKS